ncbi:hypothetical protein ACFL1J_03155, partial [Pseudomonadota bacterium]
MKKSVAFASRAILSIVLTTFSLQVWGADCSSTDIILSTQVDVDNFQSTYGGGGVCDVVSGTLTIGKSHYTSTEFSDITSLDGLSSLTRVGGYLYISRNPDLTNLNGLSNLTRVDGRYGGLAIYNNDSLTNLDGLSNVTSIGGLEIGGNPALTNIDGLSKITSVDGDFFDISYNDALTNLNGLSSLTRVNAIFYIFGNDSLTNLDGLSSLTSISSDLDVQSNRVLSRCTGIALLLGWPVGPPNDNIGGYISFNGNPP